MKKKLAAAALAISIGVGTTAAAVPAHYDPWNTHWHYNSWGQPTYKQCSWWDSLWGCKNEYVNYGPIYLAR